MGTQEYIRGTSRARMWLIRVPDFCLVTKDIHSLTYQEFPKNGWLRLYPDVFYFDWSKFNTKAEINWMNSTISVRLFNEAGLLLKFARPISEHLALSSFRHTSDKNLLLQDNKLEVSRC